MVAGTLAGCLPHRGRGVHWNLISPLGSTEIHEVVSVAVDPTDPNVIYAGTWHLPWKTTDGGENWVNIKNGIIDDSDVFSIIIDPKAPDTVFASACSGIYKSMNGGARFEKVQGIPKEARRTRKLTQDPLNLQTVYAGTTEGLYRTTNGGREWAPLTGPDTIVNDVFIDPSNDQHVLMATDRAGVLASEDGGISFHPSNTGFTARQVTSFVNDPRRSTTVYAGVVNDKESGGVFMSLDGGVQWQQQSAGLSGRDVFSLATTDDGTVLAGTRHGIFRLDSGAWVASSSLAGVQSAAPLQLTVAKPAVRGPAPKAVPHGRSAKPVPRREAPAVAPSPAVPAAPTVLDDDVYAMATVGDTVFAGTSKGLYAGSNGGRQWTPVASLQMPETRFVAARKAIVMVAGLRRIALSVDSGRSWDTVALPEALTQVSTIEVDELNNLWVGGREGVFYSTDYGLTWKTLRNLYMTKVSGIYFDAFGHRVLVTSDDNTYTFAAHLPDYQVTYWDSGWNLRFVRAVGDHLVGVTAFDGVVVQPVMVESKMADAKPGDAK